MFSRPPTSRNRRSNRSAWRWSAATGAHEHAHRRVRRSYGLRHGFAVRLLTRGVGIKTIGDLLGHRSFESTQVNLRLDTDLLRAIALPVPRSPRTRRRA